MRRLRLFMVPATSIVEHPNTLPIHESDIPEGPIVGWEAYAPNFNGDPRIVLHVENPVIIKFSYGSCIKVQTSEHEETNFWYQPLVEGFGPGYPCWYQSGSTLRFIQKRANLSS